MAASNPRDTSGLHERHAAEIGRRVALVRAAKGTPGRHLTSAELDPIIEPVPCRRTRVRLARARGDR